MKAGAFIGLGSNLDDPVAQVERAFAEIARIPHSDLVARSSLWRSAPLGYAEQPDFINAVAWIDTALEPHALLAELQRIERAHARARSFPNAPRTLDLDLLLYDGRTIDTAELVVPHPRMHERAFVLAPLLEVAPGSVIPGHGGAAGCMEKITSQTCERIP